MHAANRREVPLRWCQPKGRPGAGKGQLCLGGGQEEEGTGHKVKPQGDWSQDIKDPKDPISVFFSFQVWRGWGVEPGRMQS